MACTIILSLVAAALRVVALWLTWKNVPLFRSSTHFHKRQTALRLGSSTNYDVMPSSRDALPRYCGPLLLHESNDRVVIEMAEQKCLKNTGDRLAISRTKSSCHASPDICHHKQFQVEMSTSTACHASFHCGAIVGLSPAEQSSDLLCPTDIALSIYLQPSFQIM